MSSEWNFITKEAQWTTPTTATIVLWPFVWTTRVSRYQKKHSPTHHPDHHPIFISFFHLPQSIASSLFKLRAWQSFCTTSFHVLFGLPLGLEPSTSKEAQRIKQKSLITDWACFLLKPLDTWTYNVHIVRSESLNRRWRQSIGECLRVRSYRMGSGALRCVAMPAAPHVSCVS